VAFGRYGYTAMSSRGGRRSIRHKTARTGPSRSVIPIDPDQGFQAIPIKRSD